MAIERLASYELGDMTAVYLREGDTVGFTLLPTEYADRTPTRRETLKGQFEVDLLPPHMGYPRAWSVDPLVHISLAGGAGPGGFSRGRTMRGGPSQRSLRFQRQSREDQANVTAVEMVLEADSGLVVTHRLIWEHGAPFLRIEEQLENSGITEVIVDMVSSLTLSHLTPFATDDAPRRLFVHRFRSDWSAEGRHDVRSVEELGLERSWLGHGVRNERFGQVGTMPVRGWFPTVFVEDQRESVFWGAALAWAGSWQFELYRKDDCLNVSAGLADREYGHWFKALQPGERFQPPSATLTCARGPLDRAAARLVAAQREACRSHPEPDDSLPVVFNEWCTSWGNPTNENLSKLADVLNGEGITYLVIDAGWYKPPEGSWSNAQGDWRVSDRSFPGGLSETTAEIRRNGLIPGLWFEYECIGPNSDAWSGREALQLTLGGVPIDSGGRRFWDMRKEESHRLLESLVIDTLEENRIGYLKIDYNETAGYGADGAESDGEGIRQQILGVYRFLDRIRQRLPNLVIENCSSGGHRLEPSMVGRTAMSSFSDAHECLEIPIIAANLHRLILPRQSQVWAVLHSLDSPRRLIYTLAAGFLGRLCLSGEILDLKAPQWEILRNALELYRTAAPAIRDGESRRYGPPVSSYRHPTGWQAVVISGSGRTLVVVHRFAADEETVDARRGHEGDRSSTVSVPIAGEHGVPARIEGELSEATVRAEIRGSTLRVEPLEPFSAAVYLLR